MKAYALLPMLSLLFLSPAVRADVAPSPVRLDGSTRMTAETVDILVEKDVARVTAKFTLDIGDIQKLRYCRALQEGGSECGDWYYHFELTWPLLESQEGTFKDFSVTVNGKECDVWGEQEEEVAGLDPPITKWIQISAPRMDKRPRKAEVVVKYTESLQPKLGLARLVYVLRSGALWKGKIGSAVITIATAQGITLQDASPEPKTVAADRLVWKFKDFEPDKDIFVTVRLPLSSADEEWRRKYEENIRKDAELDKQMEEIRLKEEKLEATYQEYLKTLEELKKKEELEKKEESEKQNESQDPPPAPQPEQKK